MRIEVPVGTLERPITVIDYIGAMQQCVSLAQVASFCEGCPLDVRQDERFAKAVVKRLAELPKPRLRAVA